PSENASVVTTGKRSEVSDWQPEPAERDRRVERPSARHCAQHSPLLDEIDECLAADDDHGARPFGLISPEPRAIKVTGKPSCTDCEPSPSSRRNKSSAALRPSACGSWAITEMAGSRTSARTTSSNPSRATWRSSPMLRKARTPPIVEKFWLVNKAVGGFGSESSSLTACA